MSTWTEPKFDNHAFAGKGTRAVGATKTKEGWDTTGLSYNDFSTMHFQGPKRVKERRLPRPEWASDNEAIASVVLNAAERRLYLPHDGPNDQRRARITAESERRLPAMRERLRTRLFKYHEAATSGVSQERLRRLASQIGGTDSEIVMLERGIVGVMVSVLYMYYNLGYTSVQVAEELSLKSPAVRMLLYGLHRAYKRVMGSGRGNRDVDPQSKYIREWPAEKVRLMFLLKTNGKTWAQIGKVVKACPNSVMNHWKKYFGDLNSAHRSNGVSTGLSKGRPCISPEKRIKRQAAAALRPRLRRGPRDRPVLYYVKREGYDAKLVNPTKTAWTANRLKKLAELWNSGKGMQECAKVLGAPVNGVNYALHRILKRKA